MLFFLSTLDNVGAISCSWLRGLGFKVIGAYHLYGNFYRRLVIPPQKYFSGMNPPVFNTNAGAHLTNGGMYSFPSFFKKYLLFRTTCSYQLKSLGQVWIVRIKKLVCQGLLQFFLIILNKTYHVRMLKLSDTYQCMYNSRMLDPHNGKLYKKHELFKFRSV